ncbi:MAG: DUF4843 domain-containing protein [Dysgonamonadaceae bacterium]|jgi:hypothetical protein|nr:DUF4843 domain-containing protein [Dysgonamonadaceae bacterium]
MKPSKLLKRIFTLTLPVAVLIAPIGCESELKDYDGPESVYFYHGSEQGSWTIGVVRTPFVTRVDFADVTGDTVKLDIRVLVTGDIKNYDRQLRLEIRADSTTAVAGTDFVALNPTYVFPADSVKAEIAVLLLRNTGLRTEEKQLQLVLTPTDDLTTDMPKLRMLFSGMIYQTYDALTYTIRMNDFVTQPETWSVNWGEFTQKKFLLMLEVLGLTRENFSSVLYNRQIDADVIMSNYLIEKYYAHTPVLEDDGSLMWFAHCADVFSSTPGVPWDGKYN